MNVGTINGPFGEIRAASASTGAALTAGITAAGAFIAIPPGADYVYLEGRNFSTATVIQWALNPFLTVLKTTDSFAAVANTTDYSEAAQNNIKATRAVVLSALATTHALWVGADLPFRGVFFDVNQGNTAAATMVAVYSNTAGTMGSLTVADGTAVTGGTWQQDGAVTWTIPADWTAATLRTTGIGGAVVAIPGSGQPKYWVKLTAGAALSATVTLDQVLAMNRSTAYALLTSGPPGQWLQLGMGTLRAGCIEARTDSVTANLIVNVATRAGERFT